MRDTKHSKRLFVLIALGALSLVFIFSNSLKNGELSHGDSDFFVELLKPVFDSVFGVGAIDISFVVRKCAHLFEFACLGSVSALTAKQVKKITGVHTTVYFVLGCLVIATVDEFIQSFTGRTSSVSDVVLDFFGAVLGFSLVQGITCLKRRLNKSA